MTDEQMCNAVVVGLRDFEVGDIVSDEHLQLRRGRVTRICDNGFITVWYDIAGGGYCSVVYGPASPAKTRLQHELD